MTRVDDLIRRGQLSELRERRAELVKRWERAKGDVVQYVFPTDPLDPIESCQLELAEQAMRELVSIRDEYRRVEAAIRELEG